MMLTYVYIYIYIYLYIVQLAEAEECREAEACLGVRSSQSLQAANAHGSGVQLLQVGSAAK